MMSIQGIHITYCETVHTKAEKSRLSMYSVQTIFGECRRCLPLPLDICVVVADEGIACSYSRLMPHPGCTGSGGSEP